MNHPLPSLACAVAAPAVILIAGPDRADAQFFYFDQQECVQAAGADIDVPGYSVPSYVHWNTDGLKDLIVGQGSGGYPAKVRIYLNVGTAAEPAFDAYAFAQADGADLQMVGSGCLGCFPRVVYWDADGRKDLLVGAADGRIKLFLNVGTDDEPTFDAGTFLQVGPAGSKIDIDVGSRATTTVLDWNDDGKKDLVSGSIDGKIHIFINEGTDTEPDFIVQTLAQAAAADLIVPTNRSSPHVADYNDDGAKDLISGNTEGQIVCYLNTATNAQPVFADPCVYLECGGLPINNAGTPRSRPFIADFDDDGLDDLMFGDLMGKVYLYRNGPRPGDVNGDWVVDYSDLLVLLDAWGDCPAPPEPCVADFNGDGVVNVYDLLTLLAFWG